MKWVVDSTFSDVLSSYVDYVEQRYQQYSTVCIVFDGYFDKNSTKGNEHARRGAKMSSNVNILTPGNTKVTTSSETFLQNLHNKVAFISLLVQHLKDAGFESVQSKGDADTLIAKTALEYAVDDTVTVSAQDTDILIILLHHWSS